MKRGLHVVSALGAPALFFVFFLAVGNVSARLAKGAFPFGYWGGAAIALAVTVALCFAATVAATRNSSAFSRLWLLCCVGAGSAAWFAISILWLAPSPFTERMR